MSDNAEKPSGILIWGEKKADGNFAEVVFQLVSKAVELAEKLNNCKITVITAAETSSPEKYLTELSQYGADELVALDNELLKNAYNTKHYAQAVLQYLNAVPKEIFLIGATRQGRDFAPQISSALNTGLTADCTGLEINEEGKLAATRPTFGGELMATILSKTYPQMATVRPNVFEAKKCTPKNIMLNTFECKNIEKSTKTVLKRIETAIDKESLENAKIILAGGKGLKDKTNFEKLFKLAELLGAKAGATRKAVEAGLAPQTIQIGQTGKTVAPDLYIAFGISGAIQHAVGINGAKKIIAVNNDASAPITKIADETLVADAVQVIDEWLEML